MANDNLTAVLHGVNDLRLEQTPIEEPNDDEVLIRMNCVGICGSDVHYLVNGRIGNFIVKQPMIVGHESAGTVAKLGTKVTNLKVGDRVAIEPGVPCRTCNFCKEGRYNLCKDMVFCATPPVHGSLRRWYKHAADFCFRLPDHVSLEEGAMLEPLSVAVHACKRGKVGIGSKVLITGSGPIGLVCLLVAKAMGAGMVVVTDIIEEKLKVAKQLGADKTLQVKKEMSEEKVVENVCELFGEQPNITIEASGAQSSIRLAILATKSGGVAVLVGAGAPEVQVPLINALIREVDIRGIFRYANDYEDALQLVASGKVNLKPLITHNYKLEETVEAFETTKLGRDGAIKIGRFSTTKTPIFPKRLREFGYDFDKGGKLRKIDTASGLTTDEGFEFNISEDAQYNQKRYEALGEVINEHIYNLLENEGLKRIPVPKTSVTPPELRSFVFASEDAFTNKKLMILIHGSGVVRAGQWARRLIINDNLNSGTQIPYVRRAKSLGYGILVLNTNDNHRTVDDEIKKIAGSEDPHTHVNTVWSDYVQPSNADRIAIVAHSYGGVCTIKFGIEHREEFKKRVFAVAFTDSVHVMPTKGCEHIVKVARNWMSSEKPLDTPEHTTSGDIECVSAGHPVHEMTSWSCIESLFKFLDDRYKFVMERKEL